MTNEDQDTITALQRKLTELERKLEHTLAERAAVAARIADHEKQIDALRREDAAICEREGALRQKVHEMKTTLAEMSD